MINTHFISYYCIKSIVWQMKFWFVWNRRINCVAEQVLKTGAGFHEFALHQFQNSLVYIHRLLYWQQAGDLFQLVELIFVRNSIGIYCCEMTGEQVGIFYSITVT